MKKALLYSCIFLFALQACKEKGPVIGSPDQNIIDTTYTTDVEQVQTKKVLAEELTGVSCPPCVDGHSIMKNIGTNLDENIVVVAYHIFNQPTTAPVSKEGKLLSKFDFRNQKATDLANGPFGGAFGGLPAATFDRFEISGGTTGTSTLLSKGLWSNAAELRGKVDAPVNIHITSAYDDAAREATIRVTLAYTKDVNLNQALNVVITEDNIIDAQKTEDNIITDYSHQHVLRDFVTPLTGTQIPAKAAPFVAGRVYERTFVAKVDTKWNAENCHIVAFIANNDAASKTVLQAEEIKLKAQ